MKKICFLILISIILLTGCSIKKTTELTDAEKFSKEYSVTKNNPFKYASINEVINIIENGTGIIFFGDPDCEWCSACAKLLTSTLNYKNIQEAYYYNPKKIRENNTKEYKKLVKLLSDYLETDKEENSYLFLPDIYFIVNGKIINHNNDLASMNGTIEEVLTATRKKEIKNKYLELISEYNIKKDPTNN